MYAWRFAALGCMSVHYKPTDLYRRDSKSVSIPDVDMEDEEDG